MLFVRNDGVTDVLLRIPLLLGLLVIAMVSPSVALASGKTIDLVLYTDGSVHVSSTIEVDPLRPRSEVNLYGSEVDNFVARDENHVLLFSDIAGTHAKVETLGIERLMVSYDIHDLVSKQGRNWIFAIDSESEIGVLMPQNSVIVGLSGIPKGLETIENRSYLQLPAGENRIEYMFATQPTIAESEDYVVTIVTLAAAISVGSASLAITLLVVWKIRYSRAAASAAAGQITEKKSTLDVPEIREILEKRSEMREDDREIVIFLSENGGSALESELRKKFLQPRTTMWRAVRRLERQGIVVVEKKDQMNLIRIADGLEEESA